MDVYTFSDIWRVRSRRIPLSGRIFTDVPVLVLSYFVMNLFRMSPNTISIFYQIGGLFAGFLALYDIRLAAFLAYFFYLFDGVDGIIARLTGQTSKKGEFLEVGFSFSPFSGFFFALALSKIFGSYLFLVAFSLAASASLMSHKMELAKISVFGCKKHKGRLEGKVPVLPWFGKEAEVTPFGFLGMFFLFSAMFLDLKIAAGFYLLSQLETFVISALKIFLTFKETVLNA